VDNPQRQAGGGYRDRMELEPTDDGRWREVYDNRRCAGCQGLLVTPHVLIAHTPCFCVPHGHRSLTCLDCGHIHLEPECTEPTRGIGARDHFSR
jgi:hypothetical protein